MEKEQKNDILLTILSAIALVAAIAITHIFRLPVWAEVLIYLPSYLLAGLEVLKEAFEGIKEGEIFGEEFLMTVATIGAFAIGFLPGSESECTEAVLVMLLFKIGELFEEFAEGKSERSIEALLEMRPDKATAVRNGENVTVDPKDIAAGEYILVKPGERVALDGIITDGTTTFDMSAITGESKPVFASEGEKAISGTINLSGVITVRVTGTYFESTATKIIELVQSASETKSKREGFVDRFAKVYTPAVVALAVLIAIIPPVISGDFALNFASWLKRALSFLIISCPCALVISVPLAFFAGIGKASRSGVLVKGSAYLEGLTNVGTFVFDKTGTLTEGVFEVTAVHPEKYDKAKLLHLAAHVESLSTHPIAVSLRAAFDGCDENCTVGEVTEHAGMGVSAVINGKTVCVGNSKLMQKVGAEWRDCHKAGTVVHIAEEKEYLGHIIISDRIKPHAEKAIIELKKIGVSQTVMLTGDNSDTAKQVAAEIGIDEYHASLMPADKVEITRHIIESRDDKKLTAFAGDGINDAPVLSCADIGIAMGALGSDAAIEAADIVLMDDDVLKLADAVAIAKETVNVARQNTVFALSVKLIILLLSAFGYAPMWLAVFADVGVTVLAILNSIKLTKK